jgi:hypothetical protein
MMARCRGGMRSRSRHHAHYPCSQHCAHHHNRRELARNSLQLSPRNLHPQLFRKPFANLSWQAVVHAPRTFPGRI